MARLNEIKLDRSLAAIHSDLAARGKQELRAKVVNGRTVLYSKNVSQLEKWIGNRYFNRGEKRALARETILKCFEGFPEERKSGLLKLVNWRKPTADNYRQAFALASDRFEHLLELDDATLEVNLSSIRAEAERRLVSDDLEFVLVVRGIANLDPSSAQKVAAELICKLFQDEFNVKGDVLVALANSFGLDRNTAMLRTKEQWLELIQNKKMSPAGLKKILQPALREVANDIHVDTYRRLKSENRA